MQRSAPMPGTSGAGSTSAGSDSSSGPGGLGGYVLTAMPLPPGMPLGMPPTSGAGADSGGGQVGGTASLEVSEVLRRVRARWVLATVPVLVGVVAGGVLTFLTEPVYTARASVLVQPVIAEQFGNVNIGNVLNMATEAEVAQSLGVAAAAGKQLGVPADEVRDSLSVTTAQDTEVLKISYQARTAEVAALGAQTVATSYLSYREANAAADADRRLASIAEQVALITRLIAAGGETSSYQDILRELLADRRELTSIKATSGGRVITEAVPPTARTAPKPVTNLVAGGIAGALIGLALAVFWPRRRPRRSFVVPTSSSNGKVGDGVVGDGVGADGVDATVSSSGSDGSAPLAPGLTPVRSVTHRPDGVSRPEVTALIGQPHPGRPQPVTRGSRRIPLQPVPDGPSLREPDDQSVLDDDDQWWSKRS